MRKPTNHGWILSIFLALTCQLLSPVNSLSASPHSSPTTAKSLPDFRTGVQNENLHPQTRKRKLSGFFKIGIALNIIMMFSFAWWAAGQWRRKKRNKDT